MAKCLLLIIAYCAWPTPVEVQARRTHVAQVIQEELGEGLQNSSANQLASELGSRFLVKAATWYMWPCSDALWAKDELTFEVHFQASVQGQSEPWTYTKTFYSVRGLLTQHPPNWQQEFSLQVPDSKDVTDMTVSMRVKQSSYLYNPFDSWVTYDCGGWQPAQALAVPRGGKDVAIFERTAEFTMGGARIRVESLEQARRAPAAVQEPARAQQVQQIPDGGATSPSVEPDLYNFPAKWKVVPEKGDAAPIWMNDMSTWGEINKGIRVQTTGRQTGVDQGVLQVRYESANLTTASYDALDSDDMQPIGYMYKKDLGPLDPAQPYKTQDSMSATENKFCEQCALDLCDGTDTANDMDELNEVFEDVCKIKKCEACPDVNWPTCRGALAGCSGDKKNEMVRPLIAAFAEAREAIEQAQEALRQAKAARKEAEKAASKHCFSMQSQKVCGMKKGKVKDKKDWRRCMKSCDGKSSTAPTGFKCEMEAGEFHFVKPGAGVVKDRCGNPQTWLSAYGQGRLAPQCELAWRLCDPDLKDKNPDLACPKRGSKGYMFMRGATCVAVPNPA